MRLSRLLLSLILVFWVLVYVATLHIVASSTRDYLERAMESHAQDTATSLGLSITHSAKLDDVATIDTMANAIFDRGYYQDIVVRSATGSIVVSKRLETRASGVPDWFIGMLPLATPRMSSVVMDGWKRVAVVEVSSHPGHAYAELWRVSIRSSGVLLLIGIASLLVVLTVLRLALRPLGDMEAQAMRIAKRDFKVLPKLPWARELLRVAVAMNDMCIAVERMLSQQSELAEHLRNKAYVDDVTGLRNRNDFSEKLRHLLAAPTKLPAALLVVLRIRGFSAYNERNGRAAGDALLRQVAEILRRAHVQHGDSILARLDGPEFGLLISDLSRDAVPAFAEGLMRALAEIEEAPRTDTSVMVHAGMVYYQYYEGASFGKLMAAANGALLVAQQRGVPGWHIDDTVPDEAPGLYAEIAKMFSDGLSTDRIVLQYQRVLATRPDDAACPYRGEACVRIRASDGTLVRAGLFIPTAKRLQRLQWLDRTVIDLALQGIRKQGPVYGGATAVNLSVESIADSDFITWLVRILRAQPEVAGALIIEVAEHAIISHLQAVRTAFRLLKEAGVRLSIDRFGQSAASVGYLRSLPVDFIKIDGSYTRDIVESRDRQFFVQAIVGIARTLGIQVIMEYVETERQLEAIKALSVDAVQGYYVGKPE